MDISSVKVLWPEMLTDGAAFLVLFFYHFHYARRVRSAPTKTSLGMANHLRQKWVRSIMSENRDILGVQTLRNWVMASTFLASTAVLIDMSILSVAFRPTEKMVMISQTLNFIGSESEMLWLFKLMTLTVNFFFAFFNFTLSIRYYNHAGFMIDIPNEDPELTDGAVTEVINRGALHYFLGMRGYYLAVPLTLWLFGPLWLLAGAVILITVLHKLDRTI
ncbi:DUF599 domain-containing protein [Desulfonema ishimotonii]|uniref:DUF599 domain-containing protein n=1 Tax=Desulfonema ishimotonii TaxID=45657 RepID=A0A401FZQ4_9BACT|nr:DUF599 domain-containing protein [Desulfonema ishimotonii]GBC62427.1 DUF599 domain-containing protein [Desulfonema ishimotonii]